MHISALSRLLNSREVLTCWKNTFKQKIKNKKINVWKNFTFFVSGSQDVSNNLGTIQLTLSMSQMSQDTEGFELRGRELGHFNRVG